MRPTLVLFISVVISHDAHSYSHAYDTLLRLPITGADEDEDAKDEEDQSEVLFLVTMDSRRLQNLDREISRISNSLRDLLMQHHIETAPY